MTARCTACGLDVYDGGELCPICRADPPPEYAESTPAASGRAPTGNGSQQPTSELAHRARAAIRKHGGVRAAARALGCNHGIVSLAAKGDDFPKARRVFGLPPKSVEVEPCPDCGEVHEMKATCPDELDQQRRKRPDTSTVAFHFRDHDLAQAFRELVDGHEGGRYEWAEMVVEEVSNDER